MTDFVTETTNARAKVAAGAEIVPISHSCGLSLHE